MSEVMSPKTLEEETKTEKEKSGSDFVKLIQASVPYIMEELGLERNKRNKGDDEEKYDRLRSELMAVVMNLGKTVEETFHNTVIDERNREEVKEGIRLAMSGGDMPDRMKLEKLSEDEINEIEKIILRRFDEFMDLNI